MLKNYERAANFIKSYIKTPPKIGLILGSGLGGIVSEIEILSEIKYKKIPGFPVSTVDGHDGKLIYGRCGRHYLLVMKGRFHYYEGYTMQEITFPVKTMKLLGIEYFFATNASGGLNPEYRTGDIVFISDHINLFDDHPLKGKNDEAFGPRFPDMSRVYHPGLIKSARKIAEQGQIKVHTGVYAGVSGPTYETPAEYNYLRIIGCDLVGMSTVPEIIVAHHAGLICFALSVITDMGVPGMIKEITHEDVQDVAGKSSEKLSYIMLNLIETLKSHTDE
jgi:purine-nucleoside phosphorylase